jgi:cytochrome c biogenesis protein CcmG, thiol:disulfide interchange protein DsbE
MRRRILVLSSVVLLGLAAAAYTIVGRDSSRTAATGISLSGTDPVTGKRFSLSDYAGKPVLINVWASWCEGCNAEATDLAGFARSHRDAPLIGIDYQDSVHGARSFYKRWFDRRWGWDHPSMFDPDGLVAARLGATGVPTTIALDRRHRVVMRIFGEGSRVAFDQALRRARAS